MFEVHRERPELVDMVRGALAGRSTSALHEVAGRVFETRYVPLSDEDGRAGAGTIGVATDVTPQWRAEQEVRRSKDHLRAVMDRLAELVAIMNADGTVDYVSPSCRRVLGYAPEDLIGRNASDFVHPDDVAAVWKALAAVVGHHTDVEDAPLPTLRVRHANGSWCTLALRGYNHLDDPAVHGVILIGRETSTYADAPRRWPSG
jgi:PAS domain S-box-containing protein